ncbi:glycoside hydrolase family 13 protein [Aliiglaciecola sp. M165]|uniref:glycoside hydrolase family 13 protein n=1 Tax=Aliiglaciecola sp. M165 TaxID=2593649 RepID=UPI0011802357|nr:alpha-glucosidase [Aliiglaciecola sp. M165]TRY29874.1 alpha-glucosidase [Aliiglaciecola sp. M165]
MPRLSKMQRAWWKEAVVYQIYPRSFQDSNGDGIGDIRGIIQRLDYIKSLGIDVVWLNPVYRSPNDDNGYDISDYRNIMAEFGTMEDFDELLAGMHKRGIKLVMDLVVNHSSDEHEWFQQSRQSRDNPYRNFYHWWPAEHGHPPKRWSYFAKNGSAWKYDETTDAYYLHYFSEKQPDLNWENPKLRAEIYDMMHFWFKKGIDGFRMDVITFISKHPGYPEFPERYQGQNMIDIYAQGPRLHEYLQEMNQQVLQHYDIMTVAEGPGTKTDNVLKLVDEDRKELNMSYHFDHQSIGVGERYIVNDDYQNLVKFKKVMTEWDTVFAEKGWNTIYLGNHDFPRMVTRWANDAPKWRARASKMLTTFLLTMRGTPYYYMGDEIGMSNIKFENIEDYKDLMTLNWYHLTQSEGGDVDALIESHKLVGRDNARTPMQWNANENAGFTKGVPWIKINPNHIDVNVEEQQDRSDSELNYFRQMVALRKQKLTLVYGSYELLFPEHQQMFAYLRKLDDETLLIMLNFSEENCAVTLAESLKITGVLQNNCTSLAHEGTSVELLPYQAVICMVDTQS